MATSATDAHGAELAIELDPSGAQGTFTVVAEVVNGLDPSLQRTDIEVTPHESDVDEYVISHLLMREPLALEGNFVQGGATHTGSGGLRDHFLTKTKFGARFRIQGGTADTGEIIGSGFITNFNQSNPSRGGGPKGFSANFRFTGPMIVDGTTYS